MVFSMQAMAKETLARRPSHKPVTPPAHIEEQEIENTAPSQQIKSNK
jgi:hypothetical protein